MRESGRNLLWLLLVSALAARMAERSNAPDCKGATDREPASACGFATSARSPDSPSARPERIRSAYRDPDSTRPRGNVPCALHVANHHAGRHPRAPSLSTLIRRPGHDAQASTDAGPGQFHATAATHAALTYTVPPEAVPVREIPAPTPATAPCGRPDLLFSLLRTSRGRGERPGATQRSGSGGRVRVFRRSA